MDAADIAEKEIQKHLTAKIANRTVFTSWDGKPRDCLLCKEPIPLGRLKAINARKCIYCANKLPNE